MLHYYARPPKAAINIENTKNICQFKDNPHVMWIIVTAAWRVLGLQMEERATRYEG
jgi:hypothetical protein